MSGPTGRSAERAQLWASARSRSSSSSSVRCNETFSRAPYLPRPITQRRKGFLTVPTDPPSGRLIAFHVLTGTGTFTPTFGTSSLYLIAIGGGGGSGGSQYTSLGSASGGGGAGAVAITLITTPASTYTFTCGLGGTPGSSGGNGGNGGITTLGSPAVLIAPGGFGSPASLDSASFSAGGTVSNAPTGGALSVRGASGQAGMSLIVLFGPNPAMSGQGASSAHGTGGPGRVTEGDGIAATGFGAGAGGALAMTGNRAGAAGSSGAVLIWEYT